MLDARCPECENVAKVNDEITKVTCPHCKFEASYEKYLEMGKALDDPWIQQLDYDGTEQKINEKQLEKDFESLIQHLREINPNDNNNS